MPAAMAGGAAGIVNGFFGGGGGMVLVPLLMSRCGLDRRRAFANSVAIIFPLCALSAVIYYVRGHLDVLQALPYLIGGLGFVIFLVFKCSPFIEAVLFRLDTRPLVLRSPPLMEENSPA